MALNDFIKHLICKNPQNRMSAAQCIKHPWILSNIIRKDRLGSVDEYDALLF
jgi:serine/threonine protein kinase